MQKSRRKGEREEERGRPAALSESTDLRLEAKGLLGGADLVREEEEVPPLATLPVCTCRSGRTDTLGPPPADAMETLEMECLGEGEEKGRMERRG